MLINIIKGFITLGQLHFELRATQKGTDGRMDKGKSK
jgi:hypothetical protein